MSADVDAAREALQAAIVTDATARQVIEAIDAFEAAIRAEYEGNLQRLTEANLAYGAEIDRLRAEYREWARWIVRQGRNPEPGCPQCGPLGMDQAPSLCVPHQALARLTEAGRE